MNNLTQYLNTFTKFEKIYRKILRRTDASWLLGESLNICIRRFSATLVLLPLHALRTLKTLKTYWWFKKFYACYFMLVFGGRERSLLVRYETHLWSETQECKWPFFYINPFFKFHVELGHMSKKSFVQKLVPWNTDTRRWLVCFFSQIFP